LKILTLCTGNVARSVMLGYMLASLGEGSGELWSVRSAGTLAVEGAAMSVRTRDALRSVVELGEQRYGAHRSHQVDGADVEWSDVILASEAAHVHYVRAHFESASIKTVQLALFVRRAPTGVTFAQQLAAVADLDPSTQYDVADPAGGDQFAYDQCASQLWELAKAFTQLVAGDSGS
jgi:protein-tyrosine phosphatase